METITLARLNACPRDEFIARVGPVFEHSPWIAAAAADRRPFASREALHAAMCDIVRSADETQQLALIRAHPDLAVRLTRARALTAASASEQAAAGLDRLSPDDIERFDRYNTAYTARFGFPFVICARQSSKDAMLNAFPVRLAHERAEEIAIALDEIAKIARFRLEDLVPA